jgi:hypothetical protein
MSLPDLTAKPRRGWQRGLLISGLVLVLAWGFRERERSTAAPARPAASRAAAAAAPIPAPTPLPADASLSAPSQARPRLLALLPRSADPAASGLATRLRQACAERLAFVEGDESIAKALGIETLPAFVLYSATGRELKRLSGPDASALLAAELQALGVATAGLTGEGKP